MPTFRRQPNLILLFSHNIPWANPQEQPVSCGLQSLGKGPDMDGNISAVGCSTKQAPFTMGWPLSFYFYELPVHFCGIQPSRWTSMISASWYSCPCIASFHLYKRQFMRPMEYCRSNGNFCLVLTPWIPQSVRRQLPCYKNTKAALYGEAHVAKN